MLLGQPMIAPNSQKNQKNLPKRYLAVYSSTKNPVVCFVTVSLRKTNEMKTRGLYCIPSITQRISKRILSWYPSKPILPLPKACKQQWMMSFEQQSYQYTPCHPRPFYITGQSLLDMKNVRCLHFKTLWIISFRKFSMMILQVARWFEELFEI